MFYHALPESGVKAAGDRQPYRLKTFKYNSHYWILKFLAGIRKPSHILDLGAADGYLGAILSQQGHRVVGIESDVQLAAKARPHYKNIYVADLEKFDFSQCGQFDYVLLADVLEHLRDPVSLLRRVEQCLGDGGEIILSLPNVAHLFVRLSLLFGRFEYQDRGILDRTHLRFFTLATLKRMVDEASFRILELRPTPAPVQLVFPWVDGALFAPLHELHFCAVKLCKTTLAYQFVVRAAPKQSRSPRVPS